MPIRRTKQSGSTEARKAFVRQANGVTNGCAKNAADDGISCWINQTLLPIIVAITLRVMILLQASFRLNYAQDQRD
jgi:hypothetical protein